MANPEQHDPELKGLRRANRDDEQHWSDKGWQKIEGGKHPPADDERAEIGADFTRSPFDESLVRDEHGHLREDRADVVHGYGEPREEKNYPAAYNRDELRNPNLNPTMEYPPSTTATFKILAIVLGLLLFVFLIAALFWNFLPSVRRSPERPAGAMHQQELHTQPGTHVLAAMVLRSNERR